LITPVENGDRILIDLRITAFCFLCISTLGFTQDHVLEPKSDIEARNLETFRLWGSEVWDKGRLDLVSELVAPQYVRHNQDGTRTVTPEEYAAEIGSNRERGMKFVANARSIDGNLLWTRWSSKLLNQDGSEIWLRGIQIYRFEDSKLAETWLLYAPGGGWPDN
jgi:predicted SnoaL-like aldol condensation-catalyzing enzyme